MRRSFWPEFRGTVFGSQKTKMGRRRASRKRDSALLEMPQKRVRLGLQTVGTTPFPRIELRGGKIFHDLPVAVAPVEVPEPRVADVADVEGLVLAIK